MKSLLVVLPLLTATAAHAADRLPKSMLGTWATDLSACAEQSSEIKITVEPRAVLLYEHGYQIRRVTRLKGGSLKASGYSVDMDGRSPGSITLKLVSADTLRVGGETYHRCKK